MGRPVLNSPTKGVTIRLTIVAVAQLQTLAARAGKKLNALIREILEEHIEKSER
jgi:predicted DNA-binding protein